MDSMQWKSHLLLRKRVHLLLGSFETQSLRKTINKNLDKNRKKKKKKADPGIRNKYPGYHVIKSRPHFTPRNRI